MAIIFVPEDSEKQKLLQKILQKDPLELCTHELRWLITYVLFGEFYNLSIWCRNSIALRLYKLYKELAPNKIKYYSSPEEFVEVFMNKKFKTAKINKFGFKPIKKANKFIVKILMIEGECINRAKDTTLYSFSYHNAKLRLENFEKQAQCGDPKCSICGGMGNTQRWIAMLAFTSLLIEHFKTEPLLVGKKALNKLKEIYNNDLKEITNWIASSRFMSSVDSEYDLEEIFERVKEEVENGKLLETPNKYVSKED